MNTSSDTVINESAISVKQEQILKRLSATDKDDVKAIAISQMDLLSSYYQLSLTQATRSFRWALIASVVGLVFFLLAIGFLLFNGGASADQAMISGLGGAVSGFVAGINFFLYGKTLTQLDLFHGKLEATQRFLLANSLCESLSGRLKDYTRARLIGTLAGISGNDASADWVEISSGQAGANAATLPVEPQPSTEPQLPQESNHTADIAGYAPR